MVKAGWVFVAVLLVAGWTSPAASAARCDGYSDQAEAQRAKDTRDADGDGHLLRERPAGASNPETLARDEDWRHG
jgi:hypothetical protein